MGIRNQVGAAVIAISMVVAVGCEGGSDSGWGTVIGANEPPVIRHLRVEHDDPATPGRIRAVAELRDPERDGVEIAYAWKVAGVAQPENGPEISRIDTHAVVADFQNDVPLAEAGLYANTSACAGRNALRCVYEKIDYRLRQLSGMPVDGRYWGELQVE